MARPFSAYDGNEPYVFVSYAHQDAELVYRELTWLRDQGFNIWYDEGIQPGNRWRDELANAIDGCELFLFLVTEAAVRSENCQQETDYALDHGCRMLLVYLESVELPPGLALSLGHRQAIIRDDQDEAQFRAKLVKSIKAGLDKRTPGVTPIRRIPDRSGRTARLALCFTVLQFVAWNCA